MTFFKPIGKNFWYDFCDATHEVYRTILTETQGIFRFRNKTYERVIAPLLKSWVPTKVGNSSHEVGADNIPESLNKGKREPVRPRSFMATATLNCPFDLFRAKLGIQARFLLGR